MSAPILEKPARVRLAGPDEEDEIMQLCRDLHAENGVFDLDENKVRGMLHRAFNQEGGIIGVVGDKGSIEGVVYLMIGSYWYSNNSHLEELFLYVKPEFRTSRAAGKRSTATELMNFAKWCSDSSGLPLFIGVFSSERTRGKVRLYQLHFKEPAGAYFFYKNGGAAAA